MDDLSHHWVLSAWDNVAGREQTSNHRLTKDICKFLKRNGSDMFVFVINKTKMCKNSPQENKIF